jgi:hypothetical protein
VSTSVTRSRGSSRRSSEASCPAGSWRVGSRGSAAPGRLDRLVPFSCKGRAVCPRFGGRRMAERAAHLVDDVFPIVPVRQWVLSPPASPAVRARMGPRAVPRGLGRLRAGRPRVPSAPGPPSRRARWARRGRSDHSALRRYRLSKTEFSTSNYPFSAHQPHRRKNQHLREVAGDGGPAVRVLTCTGTLWRFSPIEPFEFSKPFENLRIWRTATETLDTSQERSVVSAVAHRARRALRQ